MTRATRRRRRSSLGDNGGTRISSCTWFAPATLRTILSVFPPTCRDFRHFAAVGPVTSDPAGNLYFSGQNIILRQDSAAGLLTLVSGNGTQGYSGDGGL